jgi:hypothetical protein
MIRRPEVVAICDYLFFLVFGQLKREILRETLGIPFDLLIESLGRHAVKLGQVGVNNYTLATDDQDGMLDPGRGDGGIPGAFTG